MQPKVTFRLRTDVDNDVIANLEATLFGPGRFARAAYQLRRGTKPYANASFVCVDDQGQPVGSACTTLVLATMDGGDAKPLFGLLLGPLVTHIDYQNQGIGRQLVTKVVEAARAETDIDYVILVGDLHYYSACGFVQLPPHSLKLPAPVDQQRLLAVPFKDGVMPRGQLKAVEKSEDG